LINRREREREREMFNKSSESLVLFNTLALSFVLAR
jgi:hypothetical protein